MKSSMPLLIVIVASMPVAAFGGVLTPINMARTVSVLNRETLPQTLSTFTGPSVGSWTATAYSNNNIGQPNFNPTGNPLALTSTQSSTFNAAGLSFSGFVFIDYSAAHIPNPGGTVSNQCDALFHVEGACSYNVNLLLTGLDFLNETSGSVSLRSVATGQNEWSLTSSGARSGTLQTGDYMLSVLLQGAAAGPTQFGDGRRQFDLSFTIPAPMTALALAPLAIIATRRRR